MKPCLMLHGLGPIPPHVPDVEIPYWVTLDIFQFIVEFAAGYDVHLTIDDGNISDTTVALPVLQSARMKAAFFIPSGRIGEPGYVGEDDIRALHEAGMEVGSHGCAHLDWTQRCDAEIARDVTRSVGRLARIINAPVRSVAIPFGQCDRRVLAVLRKLGIGRVYSSFRGPDTGNAWLVRRDCIKADMDRERIVDIMTSKPAGTRQAVDLLRVWRRAGNAALWPA